MRQLEIESSQIEEETYNDTYVGRSSFDGPYDAVLPWKPVVFAFRDGADAPPADAASGLLVEGDVDVLVEREERDEGAGEYRCCHGCGVVNTPPYHDQLGSWTRVSASLPVLEASQQIS